MQNHFWKLALAGALTAGSAHAALVSSFDANAQGWTSNPPEGALTFSPAGGNTGGYIQILDTGQGDMIALAPVSWRGDLSALLGGVFSFDALNVNSQSVAPSNFGVVTITGTAGSVTRALAGPGSPLDDGQWHSFSAALTSALWGANLSAVLANVTSVSINTEFHAGATEIAGLDNIAMSGPFIALPTPGSAALLLLGMAGMLASRYGRHSREGKACRPAGITTPVHA
jgi:hypothetical protein